MFKIDKSPKGIVDYLDNAEKQHINFKQSANQGDINSYFERNKNNNDFKRLTPAQKMEMYFNQAGGDFTNHIPAKVQGGLAKEFNMTYSKENFQNAYEGKIIVNGEDVVKLRETEDRQTGDSCFLAVPKSISLGRVLSEEKQQKDFLRCYEEAKDEILKMMERDLLPSNSKDHDKIDRTKTQGIFYTFFHSDARPSENEFIKDSYGNIVKDALTAHDHFHIEKPNVAKFHFKDGTEKFMAVDTDLIYKRQKEYTATFNTILQTKLENAGISTEKAFDETANLDHAIKLVGITREQELQNSTRKSEIQKYIAQKQNEGKFFSSDEEAAKSIQKELAEVNKEIRQGKKELNSKEILDEIKKTALYFVDPKELQKAQDEYIKQEYKFDANKIFSSNELDKNGYLDEHELRTKVINELRFTQKFNTIEELDKAVNEKIDYFLKQGEDVSIKQGLIKLENGSYTTKEVIITEHNFKVYFDRLKANSLKANNKVDRDAVVKFARERRAMGMKLNRQQLDACKLTSKRDQVSLVIGDAGVGKTSSVIAFTKDYYEQRGQKVYGLALQTNTANSLIDAGFKKDELYSIAALRAQVCDKQGNFKNDEIEKLKGSAFVVDEVSMLGSKDFEFVSKLSEKVNGNLILVGDPKQLKAVSFGSPVDYVAKSLEGTTLTSRISINQRQKNDLTKEIAENFRDKKVDEAIDLMKKNNLIHIEEFDISKDKKVDCKDRVIEKLVNDYFDCKDENKIVICGTNKDIDLVNQKIRQKLHDDKVIDMTKQISVNTTRTRGNGTKEEYTAYFAKNDKVVITQNMKLGKDKEGNEIRLNNGQQGIVKNFNAVKKTMTIEVDKKTYTLDLSKEEQRALNFSYGVSTHKSQGATRKNAFVLINSGNASSNLAYVQYSRQTDSVKAYGTSYDVESFIKKAKHSQVKQSTFEDKNALKFYNSYKANIEEKKRLEREEKLRIQREEEAKRKEAMSLRLEAERANERVKAFELQRNEKYKSSLEPEKKAFTFDEKLELLKTHKFDDKAFDDVRNDKKFVIEAVKKDPNAIAYASPEIKKICEGSKDLEQTLRSSIAFDKAKQQMMQATRNKTISNGMRM